MTVQFLKSSYQAGLKICAAVFEMVLVVPFGNKNAHTKTKVRFSDFRADIIIIFGTHLYKVCSLRSSPAVHPEMTASTFTGLFNIAANANLLHKILLRISIIVSNM